MFICIGTNIKHQKNPPFYDTNAINLVENNEEVGGFWQVKFVFYVSIDNKWLGL